jgi:hypothetical protein
MKMKDPIVEEIHRIRCAYAAQFNHDLAALVRDAQQRERAARRAGRKFVDLSHGRAAKRTPSH